MGGKMKVTVDDIIKKYKNKKGDDEAETILIDNNHDRKSTNTVSIWGCSSDISKIAQRCKKHIVSIRDDSNGCALEIDRAAFRGVVYAFKVSK
tara:strand:- start:121 stop:399 length:279 start_codon:yes stop_codon:yes gene_type:complete